jgi:outer membrane protein assembly factor BamB
MLFDPRSGALRWSIEADGAPKLLGGLVVVNGEVHDASTGAARWRLERVGDRWAVGDGPAPVLYFAEHDQGFVSSKDTLHARDLGAPTDAWSLPLASPARVLALGPQTVVLFGARLTAVDGATHAVRWTADCDGSGVVGADVVVCESRHSRLVAHDIASGARRWETDLGDEVFDVRIEAGAVVAQLRRRTTALDLATGRARWTLDLAGRCGRPDGTRPAQSP